MSLSPFSCYPCEFVIKIKINLFVGINCFIKELSSLNKKKGLILVLMEDILMPKITHLMWVYKLWRSYLLILILIDACYCSSREVKFSVPVYTINYQKFRNFCLLGNIETAVYTSLHNNTATTAIGHCSR